ncbi:hypothetical protein EW146_g4 [Bondarzewia mesenterica]|uniref:Uncharacterized protein n=1 Tax=Bondarzewia mesenterica TaxID=1095465 RepID=A0A4S4MAG5_9AGAM|nr:hypothetical protein EW146_g4 [Bondarzewia mesenterica]
MRTLTSSLSSTTPVCPPSHRPIEQILQTHITLSRSPAALPSQPRLQSDSALPPSPQPSRSRDQPQPAVHLSALIGQATLKGHASAPGVSARATIDTWKPPPY